MAKDTQAGTAGKKRRGGRPTVCTQAVIDAVTKAIRNGSFFEVACGFANIDPATAYRWLRLADGEKIEGYANRPEYREFSNAVKKAEADAELAAIARIQESARGGKVAVRVTKDKTTTKIVTKKDGSSETTTTHDRAVEETMTPPQWQADAWYLERKHRERWGRHDKNSVELTGKDGGPVQAEIGGQVLVVLPDNGRGDFPGAIPEAEMPVIQPAEGNGPATGLPSNGREAVDG